MTALNTVKHFKDLGLEFIEGDIRGSLCWHHGDVVMKGSLIIKGDKTCPSVLDAPMVEFAWRTNTGEKPAFSGKIEVQHRDGEKHTAPRCQTHWALTSHRGNIMKWRPLLNQAETPSNTPKENAPLGFLNRMTKEYIGIVKNEIGKDKIRIIGQWDDEMAVTPDLTKKKIKVDYTSEEFWRNAPEGANEYAEYGTAGLLSGYKFWLCEDGFCIEGEKPVSISLYGATSLDNDGDIATNHKRNAFHVLATRPQPKPIYTQEMVGKGEMPSVGMKCVLFISAIDEGTKGYIEYSNDIGFLFRYSKNDLCEFYESIEDYCFGPIDTRSDKEKTVDDIVSILEKASELGEDYKIDATAIYDAGYRKLNDGE